MMSVEDFGRTTAPLPREAGAQRFARAIGRSALTFAATLLAACSPDPAAKRTNTAGSADTTDVATGDSAVDAKKPDTAGPWQPACPAGIGCPCTGPNDCDVPLCLETADGLRCSAWCGDSVCPPGWRCDGQKGGADPTYFCVPEAGLLCRPCTTDVECQSAGHGGARCVGYGDAGGFCGNKCSKDADCPAEYACRSVPGLGGGAATEQCVRRPPTGSAAFDFGTCPCSPHAEAEELQTTCWLPTGEGLLARRCAGSRACGAQGLSDCVAYTGNKASCLDVQCLDPVTLQPLADGSACDDGRACTAGDVCQAGTCTSGAQQCPCEPGWLDCKDAGATNLCKGPSSCQPAKADAAAPFVCAPDASKAVVCDASLDDDCSKNACIPLAGTCTPTAVERTTEICDVPSPGAGDANACRREVLPLGAVSEPATACDDGLPCSKGDACAEGVCSSADTSGCGCLLDADCQDDGDACNGTPFCDKSGATWACKTNPATVVKCDTSSDSPCTATSCQPKDGTCSKLDKPAGAACEDGVACTEGDVCDGKGGCTSGTWTCCKSDVDCAKEEDGDLCNGTLFCNKAAGACQLNPATIVTCPTVGNTTCSKQQCAPSTGACEAQPVNESKGCEDGDACTQGDVCAAGTCKAGTDTCPCSSDADCESKDDGDLCNGTLFCNQALGQCKPNPATVVHCQTVGDTACRKTQCQPSTGACAPVDLPSGATCDADGTACTASDACDGKGTCKPGTPVCACQSDADCATKEDGNLCNGTLYCDKDAAGGPACVVNPATLKFCPSVDDTACLQNRCQPKTGMCAAQALAAGAPCDDGQPCTAGDGCDGKGSCKPGGQKVCGCKVDGDCALFDDGDVCNGVFGCNGGGCAFLPKAPDCDDGNPCTTDSCDKAKGCVHVSLPGCVTCSANSGCDDGNGCTADVCVGGQCGWSPVALGCDDADACTVNDACAAGVCKAGAAKECDDGNPCTDDGCDAGKGCVAAPNVKTCDDGDACTVGDACAGATCLPGAVTACDDGNPCTDDSCDNKTGCVASNNSSACEDGSVCSEGDTCKDGKCVAGGTKDCADGNICTIDSCDKLKGCTYQPVADGTICSESPVHTCSAGTCGAPCGNGYEAVIVDDDGTKKSACAALGPVWGQRAPSPKGVYSVNSIAGDDVVVDSQTGLMWQRGTAGKKLSWSGAKGYCDALVHAGYKDWRLPSMHELVSLVDYDIASPGPTIDGSAFTNTAPAWFWSSSLRAVLSPDAFYVSFGHGYVSFYDATGSAHEVRCVRGSSAGVGPARYSASSGGGVTRDNWTNLEWQRVVVAESKNLSDAKAYCAGLGLEGSGWRLPNARELHGLVDEKQHDPAIDWTAFPNTPSFYFWSQSLQAGASLLAWAVNFNDGQSGSLGVSFTLPVRCVRGS